MAMTLQFLIMVDADYDLRGIMQIILHGFPDTDQWTSHMCGLRGNRIEIWENKDADPKLIQDEGEGFLYYKWRVEATPMNDDITEVHQVQLAKDMRSYFEAAGCKAVVCANFEDKL